MSRSGQMRPLRGHLFWCILTSLTDFLLLSLRSLDHWSTSPGIVREAQTTLHDLEDVRIVLAGLLASLEATIVDMKKRIHPLVHGMGLASIPDEILSEIFEYELELNDIVSTSKTTGTLSLVCRRFRRVALKTPRLWSRISKYDKMPYARACLERSKSVGLSISLTFTNAYVLTHELSLLAEVIRHSSRWEHLRVSFLLEEEDITQHENDLQSTIASNLHLPSLRSLELDYRRSRGEDDVLADDHHIQHFYQSWNMPNLRHFQSTIIPKSFIAPRLSSIDLWDFHTGGDPAASEQIRDFLTAYPELEKLRFDFTHSGAQSYPSSHLVHLPNLTTLGIGAYECDSRDVRPIMDALRIPKLRKLYIETSISMMTEDDNDKILDDFLPLEAYPTLEDLTLRTMSGEKDEYDLTFDKIPGLRSLLLDTPLLVPSIPFDLSRLPPLRSLKIAECTGSHLGWIDRMLDLSKERGLWEDLKQIEVSSAFDSGMLEMINERLGEENKIIVKGFPI